MSAGAAPSTSEALVSLLLGARRRLLRASALEAALVLAAGLAFSVALGALMSALGGGARAVGLLQLAGLAATLLFAGLRYAPLLFGAQARPGQVARWLDELVTSRTGAERPAGAARIGLLSAWELGQGRAPGESEVLAEQAITRAATEAEREGVQALIGQRVKRSLGRRALGLLLGALFVALFAWLGPRHLDASLHALAALGRMDNPLQPPPPEPRLDDFKIRLRFPAYAEREERSFLSPNGHIRALPGTEVSIETRARDELAEAALAISYGEGNDAEKSRTAVEVDGRRLRASFIVSRAGRYRFQLKTAAGERQEERQGHELELELDEPPEITMLEPDTSPLEVNENDRLPVTFEARDDFGLGEVVFAFRVLGSGREGRRPVSSGGRGQKRFADRSEVDLAELGFKPGDRVAYSLEARDNDSVNGPKIGASITRELRIYSKQAHHEAVLAQAERALDELVHILGDHLEGAFELAPEAETYRRLLDALDRVGERAHQADSLLREAVAGIRKDPFGKKAVAEAFETARKELERDNRRLRGNGLAARRAFAAKRSPEREAGLAVVRSQEGLVSGLEKNVVYLADLLNDQRMIDAEALAKKLREEQQALRKALEDYRNAPDDEKRKMLAQSIQEIRQRIQEIMSQLAKLKTSIPQDYVNADALPEADQMAQMDEVQRMLEEGDLEGAMAAMERMLAATEGMLADLQSGREELGQREYSEFDRQAQKMMEDLANLEKDQRALAGETEKLAREVNQRMKDRMGDPSAFVEKQKKRLEQAEEALERARQGSRMQDDAYNQTKARLEDGSRALDARDFGAAKEALEMAEDLLAQLEQDARRRAEQSRRFGDLFGDGRGAERSERELRKAQPIVSEVLDEIEKLMPSPDSLMSKEERETMNKLRAQQQALEERAHGVGDDLDKLGQQAPVLGPQMKEMLGEAAGAMGEAKGKLSGGDAPGALGQERRAMDALGRLRQELEKAGSGRGGGPPLPFGQGEGSSGGGENGDGRINPFEKVEIPSPEQHQAPAEFRQDILEAAKQGTVQDYKEAVRRYYEELVK